MNPILQKKLDDLNSLKDYECWYLVKQPTAFDSLCYLVSILKKYQSQKQSTNLQEFITKEINELNRINANVDISNNYRALRVAAYFGLITMNSKSYNDASITSTYEEIEKRCDGKFENKDLYDDIIQRQIEKMYISSEIDEQNEGIRQNYRLYPVMLLYKVLIELGRTSGEYSISMTEYRYFVATTKKFEDFLETLLLINLLRKDPTVRGEFEKYKDKFDNRLILALKQLKTLNIDNDLIKLNQECISEVAEKVYEFESNPNIFTTKDYLEFLGSTKSLLELKNHDKKNLHDNTIVPNNFNNGFNKIFYGIPGCGKSYKIQAMLDFKDEFESDAKLNGIHAKVSESNIFRTTFFLDYTNSDFIGQIYPHVDKNDVGEDVVTYKKIPGPFTKALCQAYKNIISDSKDQVYLIVEEINRGNAAAIFGDTFQLLDRKDDGSSEYPINNDFIESYLKEELQGSDLNKLPYSLEKIVIPGNLTIFATMNTSDQNVFPLDTAFKRRWQRERVKADWNESTLKDLRIPLTNITWGQFGKAVNESLKNADDSMVLEDKQLGPYFVSKDLLCGENEPFEKEIKKYRAFVDNVIDYLYHDAVKYNLDILFDNNVSFGDIESIADDQNEDFNIGRAQCAFASKIKCLVDYAGKEDESESE